MMMMMITLGDKPIRITTQQPTADRTFICQKTGFMDMHFSLILLQNNLHRRKRNILQIDLSLCQLI